MKIVAKFCLVIIFILFPAGCSTPFLAAPTATPTATPNPTNTSTPTQTPTSTSTKTPTTTPNPVIELGQRQVIQQGGFSIRIPEGYDLQIDEKQAFTSDPDGTLIMSFVGVDSTASAEEIIDEFLNALAKRSEGEFKKVSSDSVTVNGLEGTAFNLTGSLFGESLKGKTFVVPITSNHFLYALGVSNISRDENSWENHGAKVFEATVDSIEFIEPQSGGTCPITTDKTYGHTEENAIRVGDGGDLFGGPARERAYLDNLRGPNGEPISYERTGSLNFEDTILDAYVISGLATPITLYIDIYKFEELSAPVGFTCAGSFNLEP